MYDDELERKKKTEAFKNFMLYYMAELKKVEELDRKKWSESLNKFFEELTNNPDAKIKADAEKAYRLYAAMEYASEKLEKLFALDENSPDAPDIIDGLKSLSLKVSNFAHVCLAALDKDETKTMGEYLTKKDSDDTPEAVAALDRIRDKAIIKAKEAILSVKSDGGVIFSRMIASGLWNACENFENCKTQEEAIQWSMHAKEMLGILQADPMLMIRSGLKQHQIKIVEEVAAVGENIKEGLKAIEYMADTALHSDGPMSSQKQERFVGSIMKMQLSLEKRTQITKNWGKEDPEMAPEKKQSKDPVIKDPEIESPVIKAPVLTN